MIHRLTILSLATLLLGSAALSWWASHLSLVKLPAADVWQHITLMEQAAINKISFSNLFEKHNQLHFIPVPKLVYAIDFIFCSGSGVLTAGVSVGFTLLCCLLFARIIFDVHDLTPTEKTMLSLLTGSWLVCTLQWESFVNPANLQWSGMNAGLTLMAFGLRRNPGWLVVGALLSIGCGAQWWILLAAALLLAIPQKNLCRIIVLIIFLGFIWECVNTFWLKHYSPLPILAIQQATPFTADQLTSIQENYFASPAIFYLDWLKNLLVFISRFTLPPIDQWLSPHTIIWLSPLPVLAGIFLVRRGENWHGLSFLVLSGLLTSLAAGLVRSYMSTAYTSRFANMGLLFISACFVLGYACCRKQLWQKKLWWFLAVLYSAIIAISATHESASIIHDSNQRRLSQVAYALNVTDARATSEMPYAPLMDLSYREISERKNILATHQLGIYSSHEHRIFNNPQLLPAQEIRCSYSDIQIKTPRNDHTARKITGQALSEDNHAMSSVLIRDSSKTLGYAIYQIAGLTLAEQLSTPRRWAGFFHLADSHQIEIIAYNAHQRCQSEIIPLPTSQ